MNESAHSHTTQKRDIRRTFARLMKACLTTQKSGWLNICTSVQIHKTQQSARGLPAVRSRSTLYTVYSTEPRMCVIMIWPWAVIHSHKPTSQLADIVHGHMLLDMSALAGFVCCLLTSKVHCERDYTFDMMIVFVVVLYSMCTMYVFFLKGISIIE